MNKYNLTQKELGAGFSAVHRFRQRKRRQSLLKWWRAYAKAVTATGALWGIAAVGFVLATKFGTTVATLLITVATIAIFTYLYAKE